MNMTASASRDESRFPTGLSLCAAFSAIMLRAAVMMTHKLPHALACYLPVRIAVCSGAIAPVAQTTLPYGTVVDSRRVVRMLNCLPTC